MDDIILDRMSITPEVFEVIDAGGCVKITPEHFDPEDGYQPVSAGLYDQAGQFLSWLF